MEKLLLESYDKLKQIMNGPVELEEIHKKTKLPHKVSYDLPKDIEKVKRGNYSASVRVRRVMQHIKDLTKDIRKEIAQYREND